MWEWVLLSTRQERITIKHLDDKGKISLDTTKELGDYLDKMNRDYHIEIVVHPKENSIIKTIDNETDAIQTIQNIKNYLNKK